MKIILLLETQDEFADLMVAINSLKFSLGYVDSASLPYKEIISGWNLDIIEKILIKNQHVSYTIQRTEENMVFDEKDPVVIFLNFFLNNAQSMALAVKDQTGTEKMEYTGIEGVKEFFQKNSPERFFIETGWVTDRVQHMFIRE